MNWARIDGLLTNHHPNCPHYNDSLIDVWRVSYEGSSYVVDREPTPDQLGEGEIVTKEKMHREIFENLPEFMGF
jgi:hypothetical protein